MRCKKIFAALVITGCLLMNVRGDTANQKTTTLQAIQQAPDPSAVVAAFANGSASFHNDPQLIAAYVDRMTQLGLPEIAYHQAQTLTSLEPNDGLAWAVVAHVDARRGLMPDAFAAINQAAMLNPDNLFVQRTAGEILAWYDVKADKSTLPDNGKQGLEKTRNRLASRLAYITAYNAANKAYASESNNPGQPPVQTTPEQPSAPGQPYSMTPSDDNYAASFPSYYPNPYYYYPSTDYTYAYPPYPYYAWSPWWPGPWWWAPAGVFVGVGFFPSHSAVVFHNGHEFHEHGEFHGHETSSHWAYHGSAQHNYYVTHGSSGMHYAYHGWSAPHSSGGMGGAYHGYSGGGFHGGAGGGGSHCGGGSHGGGGRR